MRIKLDSLMFLVKRKLQEYYVLLNHRTDAAKNDAQRDTCSIQRLVPNLCLRVVDEVLRTDDLC